MLKSLEGVIAENVDSFDDAAKALLRARIDGTALNMLVALGDEDDDDE